MRGDLARRAPYTHTSQSNWNIQEWFPNHGADKTRPTLDKVIAGLKEQGITTFGAVGYCFGGEYIASSYMRDLLSPATLSPGRYVFDLAFDGVIKCAAAVHPSRLEVPADIERYAQTSVPLLIESCEVDRSFPPEAQAKTDDGR